MAETSKNSLPKIKRISKKTQTVRERSETVAKNPKKRVRSVAKKASAPISVIKKLHKKQVNIPVPNNKTGKVLNKKVHFIPRFIINAFKEIKLVTWPSRRDTIKLTMAVFIFALVFASVIGVLDLGLGKAFEKFIVK